MRLSVVGSTDIGRKRKVNQDSMRLEPGLGLFVVADGMGGHAGGETASRLTVDTIAQSMLDDHNSGIALEPQDLLIGAVHRANSAVYTEAKKNPQLAGMGTTVVSMLFHVDKLYVGHVGDSRVYLFRRGMVWQLTKDHSLVQEKLRSGLITREQAAQERAKNVITRSVGFESSVLVDIYQKEANPGDIFLACSDGLSGLVDDAEMVALLENAFDAPDLQPFANSLVARANENGGDDNITVVLARVDG